MIINGKEIAQEIINDLKQRRTSAHLAIVLVGNDPASKAYVLQKELKAKEIGVKTTTLNLDKNITNNQLLETIEQLNNDNNVGGIIVQRPLPPQINDGTITLAIDPKKDIDGLRPNSPYPMPVSAAVLEILKRTEPNFAKKEIVVIGKGETGGKPVTDALRKLGTDPKIIDSKTKNPNELTKNADIIISAVGKPEVIKPEMIKRGVILISVGLYRGEDGKLHGDYDEEKIKDIASFYTPTPGGVGPVNVAMLLKNLIQASKNLKSI